MAPIMTMDLGLTMKTVTMSAKDGKYENKTTRPGEMDMTAQGESINFDSNANDEELSEEEKKMKAELSPMLELVLYQTLDKAGKVLDQKYFQHNFWRSDFKSESVNSYGLSFDTPSGGFFLGLSSGFEWGEDEC